ncbi:MAG TPA: SRPBCC family protein [Phenylobacterium sp.]|nr:SRPBCC family protein [Phenylobacterium sp.]
MSLDLEDLGEIRRTGETYELVFVRHYARPLEKVWAALTVPERLADWLGEFEVDHWAVGAPIRLRFPEVNYTAEGQVTAYDPPRRVAWTWPQEGRPSEVRFELEAEGAGCRLTLTQTALDPKDGAGVAAGWHAHLGGFERAVDGIRTTWDDVLALEKVVNPLYKDRVPA